MSVPFYRCAGVYARGGKAVIQILSQRLVNSYFLFYECVVIFRGALTQQGNNANQQ